MTPLQSSIPYGYCHCGCGQKTTICRQNQTGRDSKRGEPNKWIARHHMRVLRGPEEAQPFKIDGIYCRLLPLTSGYHAIVWESDYIWLCGWAWTIKKTNNGIYARADARDGTQRKLYMHRLILGLDFGEPYQGDHWNGCTLDNRQSNLRPATELQNHQNSKRPVTNTSGYKGVRWRADFKKWQASIKVNKKYVHLGVFDTAEAAFAAYCVAAERFHGEFARFK